MAKLSLAKLERHLCGAADILRREGTDAVTYKDYIFGLLSLKRCSDEVRLGRQRSPAHDIDQHMMSSFAMHCDHMRLSTIPSTAGRIRDTSTGPRLCRRKFRVMLNGADEPAYSPEGVTI